MQPVAMVGSLVGAATVIAWRMREARSPVSLPKILIPPLGMATGFSMFLYPPTRVPLLWAAAAVALGALVLSYPMVRASRLTLEGGEILVQRSKAFLWVLLGLVALRLGMRAYIETYLTPLQSGALFFLLAFGMVVRWRLGMLLEYRDLRARLGLPLL